jgi:hypothetical protein
VRVRACRRGQCLGFGLDHPGMEVSRWRPCLAAATGMVTTYGSKGGVLCSPVGAVARGSNAGRVDAVRSHCSAMPSRYVVVADQGGAPSSGGDDTSGSSSFLLPSFPSFLFSSPSLLRCRATMVPPVRWLGGERLGQWRDSAFIAELGYGSRMVEGIMGTHGGDQEELG